MNQFIFNCFGEPKTDTEKAAIYHGGRRLGSPVKKRVLFSLALCRNDFLRKQMVARKTDN